MVRRFFLSGIIATVLAGPAFGGPALDQNGLSLARHILTYDLYRYAVEGPHSVIAWEKVIPVEQDVSAADLLAAYQKNGLAADKLYREKPIIVWGTVQSIGRDPLGQPFVGFATEQMFLPVVARLAPEAVDPVSEFTTDAEAALYCVGAGVELVSPVVKNCVTMSQMAERVTPEIKARVNRWINGKGLDFPWRASQGLSDRTAPAWLLGWYFVGTTLSADSACFSDTINKSYDAACIEKMLPSLPGPKSYGRDEKFTALYDRLAGALRLPALSRGDAAPTSPQ